MRPGPTTIPLPRRVPRAVLSIVAMLLAALTLEFAAPAPAHAATTRVPTGYSFVDRDYFTGEDANVKLLGDVVFSRRDGSRNVYVTSVVGGVVHRQVGTPKCIYVRLWYLYQRYETSAGVYAEGGWNVVPSGSVGINSSVTTGLHRQSSGVIWMCPSGSRQYRRLWFNHQTQHHPHVNGVLVSMAVEWGYWNGNRAVTWYDVNSLGGR